MKNKLMLSALAAALVVPSLAQADGHSTFGGFVEAYYWTGDSYDPAQVQAGDVKITASASETKGDFTGFASITALVDGNGNFIDDGRTVGVTAPFGTIKMASADGATAGEYAGDVINNAGDVGGKNISYSNTFGVASVVVSFSPEGSNDGTGIGVELPVGPATVGFSTNSWNPDALPESVDTTTFGVKASLGAVDVAFHSISNDADALSSTAIKVSGSAGAWSWGLTNDTAGDDRSATRIDLSTSIGDVVGFSVRNQSGDNGEYTRIGLDKSF